MTARRRRVLAGIAGLALLIGAGIAPIAQDTDAAFTDTDDGRATITAVRVSAPQIDSITTCNRPLLGLSPVLVVKWRWLTTAAPFNDLSKLSAQWSFNGAASISAPTTGPVSGIYTTTFTGNLLGELLGGLLGGSYTVAATTDWTTAGNVQWRSPTPSTISVTVPPILGAPTCTFANQP